ISFNAKSGYKSGTILDFSLATIVETLSFGSKPIQVTKESDEIKDKKFSGKISPKLTLPPGRYYLTVLPSSNQKSKISFSSDDQQRLSASKYLVIGTIAERLEFMQNEYQSASEYIGDLDNIYKEFQKILDKSKEDKKPPADDVDFQKWQKKATGKVADIDKEIAVLMRNQGYITFYTSSFSTLHELTALLQSQLKQFSSAVITANKNKETNFSFTINAKVPSLVSTIRTLLTKETLLDLDWFYYALVEDTVIAYETIKDSPDASKDWPTQEAICDDYCAKSDTFISGFKPPVADIWKKNIGKVGESRKVALEIKNSYSKKINGDKNEALTKKLEELKKNIGEILYTIRMELKK
ncbi:MAG TPA: hypothetical protein VJC37_05655, partial [Planctomycetota bacterium]|nr:hypothetical protein [Planctomycetota bacterium]